jgi:hypothetical protein
LEKSHPNYHTDSLEFSWKNASNQRPVYGGTGKFQTDPYWQDLILFYEYFHGDNGAGIGASHQTGWTGLVAQLIQQSGEYEGKARSIPTEFAGHGEQSSRHFVDRTG